MNCEYLLPYSFAIGRKRPIAEQLFHLLNKSRSFPNLQDKGASTVDEVVKIISPDPITFGGLFAVTAILAPILEEFVFRGFLLTSFSKLLPMPAAIGLSSVAFGMAHLSVKDLPELTALGVLLGLTYVMSRNLLTPIVIHGLWNGIVLLVLFTVAKTAS